jgi:hypothetical protein
MIWYRTIFYMLSLTAALSLFGADNAGLTPGAAWTEDFNRPQRSGIPVNWKEEGTKLGVPATDCTIIKGNPSVLQIKCDKSTGGVITAPNIDLRKYPVMRWRWRVLSYPANADGRNPKTDDQPIAVYVGMNDGLIKKKSIAYRWETLTPRGFAGKTSYAGVLTVNYITMRDHNTKPGEWVIEERNIADDFQRIYGRIPKEFALSVIGNSQYTQSNTIAEIDFIEFLPASK